MSLTGFESSFSDFHIARVGLHCAASARLFVVLANFISFDIAREISQYIANHDADNAAVTLCKAVERFREVVLAGCSS
jgi:hypothetical protein